jgi:hypothetical protein
VIEPRYLAKRSEDGYVGNPAQALQGEPEAVSEDEQIRLSAQSRQKSLDLRIKRREATADEIGRELAHLEARERYLRRQLARLKR